jgi:hypothetical protein
VSFLDGSTVLGLVALSGGSARFTTTGLAVGSHSIHAVYAGDAAHTGSESAAAGVSVRPDATTIVVAPSANPSPPNRPLTLTVTVAAAAPGGGTPTGTVTIYDGKKSLGTVSLSGGMAALTTRKWKPGNHAITVIYHGDSDFTGGTSAGLRESIKKVVKKKARAKVEMLRSSDRGPAGRTPREADRFRSSMLLRDRALEEIDLHPDRTRS